MHESLITDLVAAPDVVIDLVESLPSGAWSASVNDEWSMAEIVGHLRAADAIWTPRILFAVVHDGVAMPDVDERALQDVLHAGGMPLGDQLTSFAFGRAELGGVLAALTEPEWSHTIVHAARGHMTVIDACSVLARHEAEHLQQLQATAEALRGSFSPGD